MKTSNFLTEYRRQRNLTQVELADEIGVNAGVLARLERNIGNQNVRRILNWCKDRNISPDKVYPPEAAA